MFNRKLSATELQDPHQQKPKVETTNPFILAAMKDNEAVTFQTKSENGALKYTKMDTEFATQFASAGSYLAQRTFAQVSADSQKLWDENPELAVKFAFYCRLVSRVTQVNGKKTETAQTGQGLKNEGIMRFLWLAINQPKVFEKNMWLIPVVGSWADLVTMLSLDYQFHNWNGRKLNWQLFADLFKKGLELPSQTNLVKKWLPSIKARSKCTTSHFITDNVIAKYLANAFFGQNSYAQYRKLKSSGTAHSWQKLVSVGQFDQIELDKIHGKALRLIAKSKALNNWEIFDRYVAWIGSKKSVNTTDFIHDLFANMPNSKTAIETVNKQFQRLVELTLDKASTEEISSWIVALDTSGSMNSHAAGLKVSTGDVARGIALFMSYLAPTGPFKDNYVDFNRDAEMRQWVGRTPYEKFYETGKSGYVGNTDFLSVIRLMTKLKGQGVEENAFPKGLICVSDGEFDKAKKKSGNFEEAKTLLKKAGFSREYVEGFTLILWDIPTGHRKQKFEIYNSGTANMFHLNSFDASTMKLLMSGKKPTTQAQLIEAALSQEIFTWVTM